MGRFSVDLDVANFVDVMAAREGKLEPAKVRRVHVRTGRASASDVPGSVFRRNEQPCRIAAAASGCGLFVREKGRV